MQAQSLRPLADSMPEATEDMSLGEVKLLQALTLMAARLDDVVQPMVVTNTFDIHGLLEVQKGIVIAQEGMESALRNGVRSDIDQLGIDCENLDTAITELKGMVSDRSQERAHSVWEDIINSILMNKIKTVLITISILTVLPVLQKIGTSIAVALTLKWFGIDLPAVVPWLFG